MAPIESLYGRRCRYPIGLFEVGEVALIGPELVHEATKKIRLIKKRLRMAQSWKKSYADGRKRDLQFEKFVGDPTSIVYLEGLEVKENLAYEEVSVEILDWQVKKLRNKDVSSVKVLQRNHLVEGANWEAEADMKS
ncbi:uncharacterized protein LOC125859003 [Solanum stenotomum]|uniref:uncharacterized protein LOC125859003 n=1 Tax=Solanum stenotomum TaxID=172797 RepID=UPI0020D13FF0|nr:uncharacterized protein LOC125859003 [Solanum stenotomum]